MVASTPSALLSPAYQRVFRALPDALLLMDPDGIILDNTDAHVAVSLKPRAEAVGRSLFEAYPSVDQNQGDIIAQSHANVRRTLQPDAMPLIRYDLERPAEQGGGFEESYWQATHYPILDGSGRLQYILQRTQNVTAEHQAALEAARVQKALDESNNRTRFILENLPVMVWTNRADGTPDYYNARWEAFTGLSSAQGIEWRNQSLVHADDEETVHRAVAAAVAEGREYQLEFRLRRHDGQYRWVLARNTPRRNEAGQVSMWVGAGTDIHDQKMLVQELQQSIEQQAELSDQAYQSAAVARSQRAAFEALFMQAPAPIAILRGPEHRFDFVNTQFQAIFPGLPLLGRPVAEALPADTVAGFVALLDQVYASGEPYHGRAVPAPIPATATTPARTAYFDFTYQVFYEGGERAGITAFAIETTDLVVSRQSLSNSLPL